MTQALYRKYRPKTFAEVVDQQHVVKTLQNEIANRNFAHAYIFSGPRGIGKTSIARLLAKAVNAESIKKHTLSEATLIDIVEIDAASHTGVDNVRENVIQNAYVSPTQLDYKVFIIDEVHMLSVSAFNALLKILEEPPQHVVFILATTEIHKVPATVISRCQRFDFHTIGLADTVKRLQYICEQEKVSVDTSVLERIARRSGGAIRDAESMLGQVLSIDSTHITDEQADIVLPRTNSLLIIAIFEQLLKKQTKAYLQSINQAVQDGVHLRELHASLMQMLRQAMLYTIDQSLDHLAVLDVHTEVHQELMEIMKLATTEDCIQLIGIFMEAGDQLATARIQQLPLETAGVVWCQSIDTTSPITTPSPVVTAPRPKPVVPSSPRSTTAPPSRPTKKSTIKPVRTTGAVSTDAIIAAWPEIIQRVKVRNHSLAMVMSVAHVVDVISSNTLRLGVRFDFHKQRLCDPENIIIIQDIILDVIQQSMRVECEVDSKYDVDINVLHTAPSDNIETVSADELDNVWDLALSTFEGEEVKDALVKK